MQHATDLRRYRLVPTLENIDERYSQELAIEE
jgi:hypothetical protein